MSQGGANSSAQSGGGNVDSVSGGIGIDVDPTTGDVIVSNQYFKPSQVLYIVDHFVGAGGFNGGFVSQMAYAFRGLFELYTGYATAANPGVLTHYDFSAGDNFYLYAGASSGNEGSPNIIVGAGSTVVTWKVNLATLSDNTNTYRFQCGLGFKAGLPNSNDLDDGIFFEYTDAVNSGNWQIRTVQGGVSTTTNTSTAVSTGYKDLTVLVDANATLCTFYVDGVSIGTISTNIPTNPITPFFEADVTAGTVPQGSVQIDLMTIQKNLTGGSPPIPPSG